jgi:hypothetical protein
VAPHSVVVRKSNENATFEDACFETLDSRVRIRRSLSRANVESPTVNRTRDDSIVARPGAERSGHVWTRIVDRIGLSVGDEDSDPGARGFDDATFGR